MFYVEAHGLILGGGLIKGGHSVSATGGLFSRSFFFGGGYFRSLQYFATGWMFLRRICQAVSPADWDFEFRLCDDHGRSMINTRNSFEFWTEPSRESSFEWILVKTGH